MHSSSSSSSDTDSEFTFKSRGKRFEDRIDIDYFDEMETIKRYRLSKTTIKSISILLDTKLKPIDNRGYPLTTTQQLLITLRYYATGSIQIVIGDLMGVHQTTAGKIVHRVTAAIASLSKNYIKMPSTADEIRKTKLGFFNLSGLPNCIGAIDCTHIPINSPGGNRAELYRNRKAYFSINTQAICDSRCKIMEITARFAKILLSLHKDC